MKKLRVNLRELLQARGINQLEFAEMTGIPQGTISRWAGGKVDRLDIHMLEKFCNVLDVEISELLVMTETKG